MKLLITDRDGVVLRHIPPYVLRWSDVVLMPEAIAAIRNVLDLGGRVAIVSNQSPVARRLISMDFVDEVNAHIRETLRAGPDELSFHVCPHIDGGCLCRKPRPGMLTDALNRHGVEPEHALMVGDQASDMEAAYAASIGARVQVTGDGTFPGKAGTHATRVMVHGDFMRACPSWFADAANPREEAGH